MRCRFGATTPDLGRGEGTNLRLSKSQDLRGWALVAMAALSVAVPVAVATLGSSARAGSTLEERKLPMKLNWIVWEPNCTGGVSAVGIVTSDSPKDFDDFARGRGLAGATIVF